jgi:hypothetical protein
MIKKYNVRHNTGRVIQPETGKMINGQALGEVSKLRYGLCRMSFNGCEVIAVHNALVWLGMPRPVAEIARYMERFRMLIGFFGCSPYKIGKALRYFGADCERRDYPGDADAFIVTFWTKRPFLSSVHTVFCIRDNDGILVYNIYNDCPEARHYSSLRDFAGDRRPIAVYALVRN